VSGRRARLLEAFALAVVITVAVVRVAATHRTFSATADEPQHIAGGVDWLRGGFDVWRRPGQWHVMGNPPLARIAVGLGPYLHGVRDTRLAEVLHDGPGYEENLVSARRGVLPFLAALILLSWWLARRTFGVGAGLAAAAAVSTLPPVLAHAGLATTDVAATASYVLALILALRFLEAPSLGRAAALGAGFGLAFVTKMSVTSLVPATLVVVLHRRRTEKVPLPATRGALAAEVGAATIAAGLVACAVYRFSFGRPDALADPATLTYLADHCAGGGLARRLLGAVLHLPVPAPQIPDGMLVLCATNAPKMSASYLLGRITLDGFPLFFPVALLVKSPVPFLVLVFLGLRAAVRDPSQGRWRRLAPALVALTVLVLVLPSRINIGVRHVLQMYPLMAIYVGPGLEALWRAARPRLGQALAVGLATWQLAIPFAAGPDYLPWFNLLAGRHPEDVLLDSDLDWGQDLRRLERVLAERKVDHMSIAYFGPSDLCRHRLPPGRWLRPHERATGTVVISQMYLKGVTGFFYENGDYCDPAQLSPEAHPDYEQYAWLSAYEPVARVGKSILVYDIPAAGAVPAGGAP
jgi:4-amino-4-deoxy-L-arabinose transferase-like glycosyltransferase